MSLDQMLKALMDLGLTNTDAEVYIFLATKAPQKANDIAEALRMNKQRLYPSLKNLQNKGIVNCIGEYPNLFSAVPIEEALSSFINAHLDEAQSMEENRQKILAYWQEIVKKSNP